ncbi:helix-turn-helix domain-containing protein [Deinococcus sp. HMF7604]|uniref:helix-turn-helix domain-containing protein n=1 Tax=Deinococcus betulae TaxID=2873312 RepID=UPI001CC90AB2|nr:helix-turn-helix transcriptional regulator [Deinococcus betulae]MBZ9751893.1 helix-turn-helix domain-containing protein [Deinococcus betulae]
MCVVEREEHEGGRVSYGGYCLDLSSNVISKPTREDVVQSLREGMALSQLYLQANGLPVPAATSTEADVEREQDDDELLWLTPAETNPISLEIGRALQARHWTQSELARRMGVHRAQISRLTDPFYFGQNLGTLRRVADALGARLNIQLEVS